MAYISEEECRDIAGEDINATLRGSAQTFVEEWMNYFYESGTETDEGHTGDGTRILLVWKPPIVEVSAIALGDLTIDPSDENLIRLTKPVGKIWYAGDWTKKDYDNITITYTYGGVTVPDDVKVITAQVAAFLKMNPTNLTSEGVGSYRATFGKGLDGILGRLPRRIPG
jgi:hypothetical protein